MQWNVSITDLDMADVDVEREELARIGASLTRHRCLTEDDVIRECQEADALMVQWAPITSRVIAQLPRLKAISRYGIGFDMIDVEAAAERGIPVSNVPHYCTEEVATHAFALLLASARKIVPLALSVRSGTWSAREVAHPVHRLRGQVLGLVGGGRIGSRLGSLARALEMNVVVFDPYAARSAPNQATYVGWEEILSTSDVISIHCPLNAQTVGMFNETAFRTMKPTAVLINTSRGGIVDTPALIGALRNGVIGAAAVDVLAQEPPGPADIPDDIPHLLVTPHAAWYSEESLVELQRLTAHAIVEIFETGTTASVVNAPFPSTTTSCTV